MATAEHDTGRLGRPSKCNGGGPGYGRGVHPIERLRHVARGGELDLTELVQDAALALAGFADDPAGLVTACRSLVDRHPAAGPVWWLAARVLTAADPAAEAWQVVEEVEADGTARALYRAVPEGARVLTVGWTSTLAGGLARRGDCRVLVADPTGAFGGSFEPAVRSGLEVEEVPEAGIGAAAGWVDLVLIEAQAMGPSGLIATSGARAALAVAAAAGRETWSVVPAGRVLPEGLWRVLAGRIDDVPDPWLEPDELVPLGLVSAAVRDVGVTRPEVAAAEPDCPFAPELCRPLDAPGSYR